MKEVHLSHPALINDLLRYPSENPISVTDDDERRLKAAGVLEDEKKAPAAAKKES